MTPIGAIPSVNDSRRMMAPSCESVRLKTARLSASIAGTVAPWTCSTALNDPGAAGFAAVPPPPCTFRATTWTAPWSNGGVESRTGCSAPGSEPTRDMTADRSASGSRRVLVKVRNPPPLMPAPATAGLYSRQVNSATSSTGRRAIPTTGGRYQNWLGSAWSRKTETPSTVSGLSRLSMSCFLLRRRPARAPVVVFLRSAGRGPCPRRPSSPPSGPGRSPAGPCTGTRSPSGRRRRRRTRTGPGPRASGS